MASDVYNRVKDALDIADIIGERVHLRRSSRGYMGLCPFHHEDTPSFHVYTDTQSYYCFGCHEAGNIFTYIMKTEGLSFPEALELLAGRAGIDIKASRHQSRSRNLYDVMNIAAKFFTDTLMSPQGTIAREYMKRRNMGSSDVSRFMIGYSPNSWDSLSNYLRKAGISDRMITSLGLAVPNSRGIYDSFRGRLMFPIKDISGRVIAFGGRIIDGEGAKYINSPENEIYSKRRNLYLLHEARRTIREKGRSILVEGYMDAIRLHKSGYTEAAASLGTSLTPEQAELLSRFGDRCYICYDSDNAGQNAALKGMYILQEKGLDVHVITIPEGKDPDDYLCTNPPENFEELIQKAEPLILHHIEALRPRLENRSSRRAALNELFEGLSKLTADEVLQYKAQICAVTLIPPAELESKVLSRKGIIEAPEVIHVREKANDNNHDVLEAGLCSLLFHNKEFRQTSEPEDILELLQTDSAKETAYSIMNQNVDTLEELWLSTGDYEKSRIIAEGDELCRQIKLPVQEKWETIRAELRARNIKRQINAIRDKMKHNSASDEDLKRLQELLDGSE